MTWPIGTTELEGAIVRHCSPTLAGLKPASLFTFPGSFTTADGNSEQVMQRRQALTAAVAFCRTQIVGAGMDICVLAWKKCGALIYIYRPQALCCHLESPEARHALAAQGYPLGNLPMCLAKLGARLSEQEHSQKGANESAQAKSCPCEQRVCAKEFPHEIGFFLGYPPADVMGFVQNHGRSYLAVGAWKVYANKDDALRTFATYRRCTKAYRRAYRHGRRLARLAVTSTRI